MTGGGTTGATPTSRAPRPNVNSSNVNQDVEGLHSRPTTQIGQGIEVNKTRSSTRGDESIFTPPAPSQATDGPSNPTNAQTPSIATLDTTQASDQPQEYNWAGSRTLSASETSNRNHRPISDALTQPISANSPPATTSTPEQPPSETSRQPIPPDLPPLQTTPRADWYRWQPAKALRFSAGLPPSSTMATAPSHAQPAMPATTQTPPVMSPVSTHAPGSASRKRPGDALDQERRTRSRLDGPAVSQMPTPSTTPILPSTPYLVGQLADSVTRLRQQQNLNMIDDQRLSLLQDACKMNDMVYIILHQVYCISFHHRGILAGLNFTSEEFNGLAMLEPVLVHNNRLTQGVLSLAMNFPRQPYSLFELACAQTLTHVRNFLSALGKRWDVLRNTCRSRGYPPSTVELAFAFSLDSPTMQKTLYNSIHRQLSGVDNPQFGNEAFKLFLEDQEQLARRPLSLSHDLVVQDGQRFGQLYQQLRMSFMMPPACTQHPMPQPRRASAHSPVNSNFSPNQLQTSQRARFIASHQIQQQQAQARLAGFANTRPVQPPPMGPVQTSYAAGLQHVNQPPFTGRFYGDANPPAQPTTAAALMRPHMVDTQLNSQTRPKIDLRSVGTPLLPQPGYPVPFTTNPNPDRVALHQAHLRSPIPYKRDLKGKDMPDLRLYQYVTDLTLAPQKLDSNTKYKEWHFHIDHTDFLWKAQDVPATEFFSNRQGRLYKPGSYLFRLKAMSQPATVAEPPSDAEFNVAPTSWPQCCFISINECADVEFRRRQHHGRDLPADLTSFVQPGSNIIRLSNHSFAEEAKKAFYFAVERILVDDHLGITLMPSKLSATESLASITSALASSQDDEVSFADPYVSIDLMDPFMATVWRTPVRGKTCKHRECFDLQAFLLSRTSKFKDGPTNPDQWMCPICKKDARPHNLVIDEFFGHVRSELEKKGQLDARAILVRQDGSWEAKFDKDKKDSVVGGQPPNPTQAPGLGADPGEIPGAQENDAGIEAKETFQTTTSGSATPAAGGASRTRTQTPVAATVIEIDDDD